MGTASDRSARVFSCKFLMLLVRLLRVKTTLGKLKKDSVVSTADLLLTASDICMNETKENNVKRIPMYVCGMRMVLFYITK